FSLPSSTNVKLKIYTLLGQEVITLVDENLPAGTHERSWNGRDQSGRGLSSGVYLLRLVAGPYRAAQKMILVK
ncbi:MAG: FlgD immunoglobulin-like domain containing protein, partial [Bacteroidota bacterium]